MKSATHTRTDFHARNTDGLFAKVSACVTLANGSECHRCDSPTEPFSPIFMINTEIPELGEPRCSNAWPLCQECAIGILEERAAILKAEAAIVRPHESLRAP